MYGVALYRCAVRWTPRWGKSESAEESEGLVVGLTVMIAVFATQRNANCGEGRRVSIVRALRSTVTEQVL